LPCRQLFGEQCDERIRVFGLDEIVINVETNTFDRSVHCRVPSQSKSCAARIGGLHGTNHVIAIRFALDIQIAEQDIEFLFRNKFQR
jgi:hypothetical protein